MDGMTELKLVRGARLRWGLGTWICRRHLRWFKCWTRGCYCRQRRPALDLEDGVEVGFVDGTEDGVVDWFVGGYVECGWRRSGSDEGKLHGYMEGSVDGSNVWIQGWHWRQFSTWCRRWCWGRFCWWRWRCICGGVHYQIFNIMSQYWLSYK